MGEPMSVPSTWKWWRGARRNDRMILVTGFAPYREPMNASGELVRSMRDALPGELSHLEGRLAFEVIGVDDDSRETEHATLEEQLQALLRRYNPRLCIHTGQAPPYNKITFERIATNSFMQQVIDPERPVGYWSDLPGTDQLKERLELEGIPAGYSFYGGQHLCNHILYSSLHFSRTLELGHKAGFVHVPLLPEQVLSKHRQSSFMTLDMLRRALALVIQHVDQASGE